jgi:hypothetical protein
MIALLCFLLTLFASSFKSKSRLEAENAVLRCQLIVLRRKVRGRVHLTNGDRLCLLYGLVIVRLARRDLVWINVTPHPTAEWIARQITEAFPWNEVPRYLIRDRDQVYGAAATRRLRAMGRSRSRDRRLPVRASAAPRAVFSRGPSYQQRRSVNLCRPSAALLGVTLPQFLAMPEQFRASDSCTCSLLVVNRVDSNRS